jgi:hypothetical protein
MISSGPVMLLESGGLASCHERPDLTKRKSHTLRPPMII